MVINKDISISLFLHLIIVIAIALASLFNHQTIIINQINVSLVSSGAINSGSYKPLNIDKKDIVDFNTKSQSAPKTVSKVPNKSVAPNAKLAAPKPQAPLDNKQSTLKEIIKEPIAPTTPLPDNKTPSSSAKVGAQGKANDKERFLKNILQGLDKGELSAADLGALNEQIRGCWFGQLGHDERQSMPINLILEMNPDATVKSVKVEDTSAYHTPLKKALLLQVLRALKDPKCQQLELPAGGYNNWRIIHMQFNPLAEVSNTETSAAANQGE